MISSDRSVSGWKQFSELFKRNFSYLMRNKVSIQVLVANASIIALVMLALFFRIAGITLSDDLLLEKTRNSIYNWVGLSFMLSVDLLMTSVVTVTLQMTL
jgi:hypothetical protein